MRPLIQTFSGSHIDFVNIEENQYNIWDIAHALSNICRFSGHSLDFYSVAQHCVIASRTVPLEYAYDTLMHDMTEAYLGDISSPLKKLLHDYTAIEHKFEQHMRRYFGCEPVMSDVVKNIDLVMLATERRDLMFDTGVHWPILDGVTPLSERIECWTPSKAKIEFINRYMELVDD